VAAESALPSYSLFLSLNYSFGSGAVTHYFCLYIAVCGSGAVCMGGYIESLIICLYHITVCGSAPVTLNVSLFIFILQFAAAAQSALRSYTGRFAPVRTDSTGTHTTSAKRFFLKLHSYTAYQYASVTVPYFNI
jgi:hypothetical protein